MVGHWVKGPPALAPRRIAARAAGSQNLGVRSIVAARWPGVVLLRKEEVGGSCRVSRVLAVFDLLASIHAALVPHDAMRRGNGQSSVLLRPELGDVGTLTSSDCSCTNSENCQTVAHKRTRTR